LAPLVYTLERAFLKTVQHDGEQPAGA
jgi:hypothetical protein